MKIRIGARAAVYDRERDAILLVRCKGADYWHLPGGGWEAEKENILECAAREVKEETGLEVEIGRFLYMQEFHSAWDTIILESFFLSYPKGEITLREDHIDQDPDGSVEESGWFTRQQVAEMQVYPEVFRDRFWKELETPDEENDRFLGVNADMHTC